MPTRRTPLLFPHDDRARYERHQLAFGRAVTLLLMVAPLFISASYLLADRPRGLAVALPFADERPRDYWAQPEYGYDWFAGH